MLWVTRARIHLDRVASPWLITRFVDREAVFGFLGPDETVPDGARPFGISGVELGAHDANGSSFRKILAKFSVEGPELQAMACCVETGIAIALRRPLSDPDSEMVRHGTAMAAFSEAMAVLYADDDLSNLAASAAFYDAVYVALWARFGNAPELPDDLAGRIRALSAARDWSAVLPAWISRPAGQDRLPPNSTGGRAREAGLVKAHADDVSRGSVR